MTSREIFRLRASIIWRPSVSTRGTAMRTSIWRCSVSGTESSCRRSDIGTLISSWIRAVPGRGRRANNWNGSSAWSDQSKTGLLQFAANHRSKRFRLESAVVFFAVQEECRCAADAGFLTLLLFSADPCLVLMAVQFRSKTIHIEADLFRITHHRVARNIRETRVKLVVHFPEFALGLRSQRCFRAEFSFRMAFERELLENQPDVFRKLLQNRIRLAYSPGAERALEIGKLNHRD